MLAQMKPRYTADEYLALEEHALDKSEYHDGEIFLMPGASLKHNRIVLNTVLALTQNLEKQPFAVYAADVKVAASSTNSYVYPDVLVLHEPPEFMPGRRDTVTNPLLIAEILSPSTRDYDRGRKFEIYRTLPSFTEYLLIHHDRMTVEHYDRVAPKEWRLREYDGVDTVIRLVSVPAELSLQSIYGRVDLSESD